MSFIVEKEVEAVCLCKALEKPVELQGRDEMREQMNF